MLIVVYGPEQQAPVLKSILLTHGIQLDTIFTVFEADDMEEEEEHSDTEEQLLAPPTVRQEEPGKLEDSDVIYMGGGATSNLSPFGKAVVANRRGTGSFTNLLGNSAAGRPTLSMEFQDYVRQTQATSHEAMREQIDELFASFKSFEQLPETEPSRMKSGLPHRYTITMLGSRVKSALYKHQKMALTFLLQRERDFDVRDTNSVISSFWKVVKHDNEELYQNVLTGVLSTQPPTEAKGGILADEVRVHIGPVEK